MFSIPDDTQVYTTDTEKQFFAFTHHLALFDINARGYVHPVALSYITCDPEKIVWRFEDFSERFNEVSRLMKKGNFSNFAMDLKCRLMDLEYTQKRVLSHDEEKQQCHISVEAMEQAITVTRLMIDSVESYLIQLIHESTHELLSDYYSTTTTSGTASSRKTSDGFLTTTATPVTPTSVSLPEISNDNTIRQQQQGNGSPLVFPLLALIPQSHEDQNLFEEPGSDYEPKFVDTLHPVSHFERKLRSLAQLCQEPKQQHHCKTTITKRINHLPTTVIPLVSTIEPPRTTILNENNNNNNDDNQSELKSRFFANTMNEDMYSEAIKSMTEMTHDFGFSSEILDLIEDEEMYLQPPSGVLLMGGTFITNMKNPSPRKQRLIPHSIITTQQQQQESTGPVMDYNNNRNHGDTVDENEKEEESLPIHQIHHILWHHDDIQSLDMYHLETLEKLGDTLPHLIFALLTGRPVVVMSDESSKQRVKNTIRSLSIFIPSQPKIKQQENNELIHEWFQENHKDKSLLLTDVELDSIKLVGIAKDKMDTSIYKLDMSCLDISNEQHPNLITSPLYLDGYWINQIMDRLKYFTSDGSFFAYLQTIFMSMALKAYVYHHMYSTLETKHFSSSASSFTTMMKQDFNNTTNNRKNSDYWDSSSSEGSGLGKKWSVRRIMSYLRRIEEREDNNNQSNESFNTVTNDMTAGTTTTTTTDTDTRVILPLTSSSSSVALTKELVRSASSSSFFEDHHHHQQQQHIKSEDEESDDGSSTTDGMTLNERRGRRFLEQKLNIHGDDQNIVIYISNSIL
ncbi:hypothetical protein BDC45DRAFT_518504 [Circinella umbellata]|nr:hypothetical protein BDC45DRAFT_518504 [Circinella umbellata]